MTRAELRRWMADIKAAGVKGDAFEAELWRLVERLNQTAFDWREAARYNAETIRVLAERIPRQPASWEIAGSPPEGRAGNGNPVVSKTADLGSNPGVPAIASEPKVFVSGDGYD